jgi:hypothetical protein
LSRYQAGLNHCSLGLASEAGAGSHGPTVVDQAINAFDDLARQLGEGHLNGIVDRCQVRRQCIGTGRESSICELGGLHLAEKIESSGHFVAS